MRYRIPVVLASVMAVLGLLAPAALAAPSPHAPTTCTVHQKFGPYHIVANDNGARYGIQYHGPVSQVTTTTSPGDSYLVVAACVSGDPIYAIQNAYGNCLRMHDRSSGYGVYEEDECEYSNTLEQWAFLQGNSSNLFKFQNEGLGLYLGVKCPATNGSPVIGTGDSAGDCNNWLL